MSNQLSLEDCILHCAKNKQLIAQFDRLYGANVARKGSPLELAIDKATGQQEIDAKAFAEFVVEHVYVPLVKQALSNEPH